MCEELEVIVVSHAVVGSKPNRKVGIFMFNTAELCPNIDVPIHLFKQFTT